ncbi:hypothetical protein SAMN02745181_3406 [Rubritalea squalenifaciens DSM 18772]|uniref:Uncharacterized protein n=1 Tax=Rubritalea squalenifaciens DSM 18772 TaxID=1123071 RepID=A0A1M6QIJ4_9BACT|nr:hypothetical protein [Rubritalea squalenifaciens]SHK19873.1 hypothetical protein SAMN02745181_3406 [Rubritalea squalenifaciens DSM 18772]
MPGLRIFSLFAPLALASHLSAQDAIVYHGAIYHKDAQAKLGRDAQVLIQLKEADTWDEVIKLVQSDKLLHIAPTNISVLSPSGKQIPITTLDSRTGINLLHQIKNKEDGPIKDAVHLKLREEPEKKISFTQGKPKHALISIHRKIKASVVIQYLEQLHQQKVAYLPIDPL